MQARHLVAFSESYTSALFADDIASPRRNVTEPHIGSRDSSATAGFRREEGSPHTLTATRKWHRTAGWIRSSTTALGIGVVAVCGAAAFLRLWRIDAVGFNSDEAVYAGQGAAIAGDEDLQPFFPVFRAHPLLFQTFLSLGFRAGYPESFGRFAAALVGVATVVVVWRTGTILYGRRAGLYAALLFAVMPYHVIVTRQILLDGAMALFATLTLLLIARHVGSGQSRWLYAAAVTMGLAVLSKETAVLLLVAIYAFYAISPEIRVRLRDVAVALMIFVLTVAPFPLSLLVAGQRSTGHGFLVWQLFRRPNHTLGFYPVEVTQALGLALVVAALAGLWLLRHEWSWRERLLLTWIVLPAVFFELWPVKGFQYLLPIAAPLAILGARTLARWPESGSSRFRRARSTIGYGAVIAICLSLALPSWGAVRPSAGSSFLAGTGGVPGGREAGRWLEANTPQRSVLLTIGPSMANILEFYGHRRAYGLSVSLNPLHRNPVYVPLRNPDAVIRHNELQYVVWDAFSADRSPYFAQRLLRYVDRYNGRAVHSETVRVTARDGRRVAKPVIVIYAVHP
jgi:hypothetical protein